MIDTASVPDDESAPACTYAADDFHSRLSEAISDDAPEPEPVEGPAVVSDDFWARVGAALALADASDNTLATEPDFEDGQFVGERYITDDNGEFITRPMTPEELEERAKAAKAAASDAAKAAAKNAAKVAARESQRAKAKAKRSAAKLAKAPVQPVTVTDTAAAEPESEPVPKAPAMTNAERQARYRAAHAKGKPVVHYLKPANRRRSRPKRWADAVEELQELQEEYREWLNNLPEGLQESATAEALQAIDELDLEEIANIEPPRGFGRD